MFWSACLFLKVKNSLEYTSRLQTKLLLLLSSQRDMLSQNHELCIQELSSSADPKEHTGNMTS